MTRLSELQEALSRAVQTGEQSPELLRWVRPAGKIKTPELAIEIYQSAYQARLIEGLGEIFECFWSMVGDDLFYALAGEYFRENPSEGYSLSTIGEKFPEFVCEKLPDQPLFFDLLDFERVFEKIFHQRKDNRIPPSVLNEDTLFILPETLVLKSYRFDVYKIWQQAAADLAKGPTFLSIFRNSSGRIQMDYWDQWQLHWLQQHIDKPSLKIGELSFGEKNHQEIQAFFSLLGQRQLILPAQSNLS